MGTGGATMLQRGRICRATTVGTGLHYALERLAVQPRTVETTSTDRLHGSNPSSLHSELETMQVLKTSRLVNDVQTSQFSRMGRNSCVNRRINDAYCFTGAFQPGGHSVNSQTLPISSQITPLNNVCPDFAQAPTVSENSLKLRHPT